MSVNTRFSNRMILGVFLLNILFFPIYITTLFFLLGIKISFANIILSFAAATLFTYYLTDRSVSRTIRITLLGTAIAAVCVMVSVLCYDWSYDGNAYHKSVVGLMKNGWNPLKESFYSFAGSYDFLKNDTATWLDAYPKAMETWGACIYSFTGNIESGKAFNLLSISALYFVCMELLCACTRLKTWQTALCAGAFVLNPVSISQCLTYYVDSFLWMMLLLFLAALIYLSLYENGRYDRLCRYLLFMSISVGLNVKFSGLIFFGILGIAFFLYWSISRIREKGYKAAKNYIAGRFLLLLSSVLCALLFIGSDSYITNIIRYRNPLYTMIGENSTELIISQLPPSFVKLSNVQRFFASFFSKVSNSLTLESIQWKLPFTIYRSELIAYADTRICGWGILFSGIFLLNFAVLICAAIKHRRNQRKQLEIALLLLILSLLQIAAVPGLFWARYFVEPLYVPAAAMIVLFLWANRNKGGKNTCFLPALLLSALLVINSGVPILRDGYELLTSYNTHKQLEQFSTLNEEYNVTIGYSAFNGLFFNLQDMGISDYRLGEISEDNCDGSLFGNVCLYYKTES